MVACWILFALFISNLPVENETSGTMREQSWISVESNIDDLNKYIHNLGVSKQWQFLYVFGLDPGVLNQRPAAVVLRYPITEKSESKKIGESKHDTDVYFVKQTIRNACGTVAIVNALANNQDRIEFEDGKPFANFLQKTLNMSSVERGDYLQGDQDMGIAHENTAQAPLSESCVNTNFVSFVCKNGGLYSLNGRSEGPTYHGDCTEGTLLENTVAVVEELIERDPDELNFTLMALCKIEK